MVNAHPCPRCRAPAEPGAPECAACGYPFTRLCTCGATYHLFDGRCGACGRSHRRERGGKRSKGARTGAGGAARAAGGVGKALAAAFRRRGRRRGKGACPSCGQKLTGPVATCPACEADLMASCRCGARNHRIFDARCRECGYPVHRRKKGGRRRVVVAASAVLALLVVAGVAFVALRRGEAARLPGYYDEGVKAFQAGRYPSAAGWFRKFLSGNPRHAAAHFMLGQSLHLSGSEEAALAEIQRAHELDPDLDAPLVFLGRRAMEAGDHERALALLERSVRADPRPPEALLMIGRIQLLEGRISLGIEALAEAIEIPMDPPPVDAALLLADLHARRAAIRGRPEDASEARRLYSLVVDWEKPEGADDADPDRDANLARGYLGLGQYKQALYRAERAARAYGAGAKKADMLLLAARANAGQGVVEDAVASADRALTADPAPARYLSVAETLRSVGRGEERRALLEKAMATFPDRLDVLSAWAEERAERGEAGAAAEAVAAKRDALSGDPEWWLELASLRRRAGDEAAALEELAAARKRFPEDRRVRFRELSNRLDILGGDAGEKPGEEFAAAVREVDEVLRSDPSHPVALLLKGKALLYAARSVEALRYLQEAAESDPTDLEIAIFAGLAFYRAGNFEEAALRLDRALSRTGAELPGPRLALADCYYRIRLLDRAAAVAESVVKAAPDRLDARRLLGRILLGAERLEEARGEFEALQRLDPTDVETALYIGYLNLLTRRSEEAEKAFAHARELATDPEDAFRVARVEAEYYRRMRMNDRAVGVFRDFLDANPTRSEARIGMADFLLTLGQKDEAVAAYREVLASDPENVTARRRIAEFEFEAGGDLAEVERQIAEIERRVPDAPDLLYLRGKLAAARKDPKGAVADLTRYIDLRPDDADGHYALGVALFRAGRAEDAIVRLEAARALLPESMPIRQALAQIVQRRAGELYSSGDYEGAKRLVEKALRYDPGLTDARLVMANSLARLGELAGSEEYALAVVRREPKNLAALRLLGSIRMGRGRYEEAADALQQAIAVSDQPAYDRYLLAEVYLRMGKPDAALDQARRAAGQSEDPMFAADVIVSALLAQNATAEAADYAANLVSRQPENPRAHALLGTVRRRREEWEGARQSFTTALDLDPGYYPALWQLVTLEIEARGDRAAAMQEALFRYESAPDDPELNYLVAWLHVQALELEEAKPYLEKALRVNPEHRSSALLFAKVAAELGEPDAGREPLFAVLKQNPRDADALFDLAASYDRAGNTELAVRKYREVVAVDPGHAAALNNLAMHLIDVPGRTEEARVLAERALARSPENPVYLDTLGRVQTGLGNYPQAARAFEAALSGFQRRHNELETRMLFLKPGDRALVAKIKAEAELVLKKLGETKRAIEDLRKREQNR